MKVCLTSDWHGYTPAIPPCDLLVLAGDYEPNTNPLSSLTFYRHMGAHLRVSEARHIVMIAGNHDWLLYHDAEKVLRVLGLGKRLRYLQDFGCEVGGRRIWGTPWTPPFFNWAFMKDEAELREVYTRIPASIDILVTHGPARGVLDGNGAGVKCGSLELAAAVRRIKPQLHVFGHIHEDGGKMVSLRVDDTDRFVGCYNACHVDACYWPKHAPRLVEMARVP